jgi:hypothetical protein
MAQMQPSVLPAPRDAFGYARAFDEEVRRLGEFSADDLAVPRCEPADRLPSIGWDPTTARFWSDFNRDLNQWYYDQLLPQLHAVFRFDTPQPDHARLERFCQLSDEARDALRLYHAELEAQRKAGKPFSLSEEGPLREFWQRHSERQEEARRWILEDPLLRVLFLAVGYSGQNRLRELLRVRFRSTRDVLAWFHPSELENVFGVRGDRAGAFSSARLSSSEQLLDWLNLRERRHLYNLHFGKPGFYADFRLNEAECALLRQNGFVVSERLGGLSFGEVFYRLYSHDLPVFISTDAVLHAWHRSYERILEELEDHYLAIALESVLAGMAAHVPDAHGDYGRGVLADSVMDADYFLAVARSLLADSPVGSALGQDERVRRTLDACSALEFQEFPLFGRDRKVDFSQLKPRGRYENSPTLRRYFQTMTWCGQTDLRIAGGPEASPRELGAALVLHDLLRRSDQLDTWRYMDRLLQAFVGPSDCLNFEQLGALLARAEVYSLADVKDEKALIALQAGILAGSAGVQQVRAHPYLYEPFGPDRAELPRSFAFLGQRFTPDSWVLAHVVFPEIVRGDVRLQRRVPSALDVAYAVLGNDEAALTLAERMAAGAGMPFRDGLDYAHNLAAARSVIDSQSPASWQSSIYLQWLACLRELSRPATAPSHPEAMRTKAWGMKTLNTQLASWTQLRHANILHVKQSYSGGSLCEYPAGYVEPVPRFWGMLKGMAAGTAALLENTPFPDRDLKRSRNEPFFEQHLQTVAEEHRDQVARAWGLIVNPHQTRQRQVTFLRHFAAQIEVLEGIARKEEAGEPLSADELRFLRDVIQIRDESGGPYYNGWYPGLFYSEPKECGRLAAVVADVHTDVPDPLTGDPGYVLHEAVGRADLLLVAVDSGPDRMLCAGPVFSHYEFASMDVQRETDLGWRQRVCEGRLPSRPEWTQGYLAPHDTCEGDVDPAGDEDE